MKSCGQSRIRRFETGRTNRQRETYICDDFSISIWANSQTRGERPLDSEEAVGDRQNPEGTMQRRGLVVDDEPVVCELIRKVLHSAGMEALTLTRSTEAPEIIDEGKFDMGVLGFTHAFSRWNRACPADAQLTVQSHDPHCPDQRRPASQRPLRWICCGRKLLLIQAHCHK